ncbi:MAG: hypothetical protein ACI86X_001243 [Moritella sp.]|jgi:hypothetical protein
MSLYDLPFAKITILREDIAEVCMKEGVEIDVDMLNEYHAFLLAHLRAPFSLLVNKVNTYSYDFEAQKKLGTLLEINAIAVVAYSRVTRITMDSLASFPREIEWNMALFTNRTDALTWLIQEQNKLPE